MPTSVGTGPLSGRPAWRAWSASHSTSGSCATFTRWNHDAGAALFQKLRAGIEGLFPGYFALVMATGIVSLAAHFLGYDIFAAALFWLNHVLFIVLVLFTLARVMLVPGRVLREAADHQTGPTFLTIVAGTCVFGIQHVVQGPVQAMVATVLW